MSKKRKNGISVLIPTQNEENTVSLCIRSFLDFGDELIVVDNGSEDNTKEIICNLQARYSEKIKFFDKPELPDLYQNRQFAFQQSSYEWIVRCDSDFVAYTDGPYNILGFREFLLSRTRSIRPEIIYVPQFNLVGDFLHTGTSPQNENITYKDDPGFYQPPISPPMPRFYRYFPFFKFKRLGRWEGVRFQRLLKRIYWDKPLWVHCSLKSNMNLFFRSERTNWRESGDYNRFPTLKSYVRSIVEDKYGTKDMEEAAGIYMEKHFYPNLQPHDPEKHFPLPSLIKEQLNKKSKPEFDNG